MKIQALVLADEIGDRKIAVYESGHLMGELHGPDEAIGWVVGALAAGGVKVIDLVGPAEKVEAL